MESDPVPYGRPTNREVFVNIGATVAIGLLIDMGLSVPELSGKCLGGAVSIFSLWLFQTLSSICLELAGVRKLLEKLVPKK